MLDSVWGRSFLKRNGDGRASDSRVGGRTGQAGRKHRPQVESLETRQLLTAALAVISPVSVPQSLGYQVPLDGSASNTAQTYTVTSSNPDIKATIASGKFLTMNISHTSSGQAGDPTFSGNVTFQLFDDLTPMTTGHIETFVNDGYYNGKTITRIAGNFSNQGLSNDFVIQGGAPNADGTGSSGQPGTPFGLEIVQQLAYVNPGSLAMARGSSTTSNDTQFFFTTGTPTSLDQQYTIFGQVVAGQDIINDLTQVATTTNANLGNEKSSPVTPVTINSATLSTTNPNGVIHIDATGANAGETSNIVVTATDPLTNTTAQQNFQTTVTADTTTHASTFTFKPLAAPVTAAAKSATPIGVQLSGTTQNPSNSAVVLSYALASQPSHGTISNFDASKGTLTYTSNSGFTGTDTFTYSVTNTGGSPSPLAGNTQTVTLNVTANAVTPTTTGNTGTVRIVGNVLVVSLNPPPNKSTPNVATVTEVDDSTNSANNKLEVIVNGTLDTQQPLVSAIDSIVVFGSKGSDHITIDPSVSPNLNVSLDGGRGGKDILTAGAGPTNLLGWYGRNTLVGGTGQNSLVGRAGRVRFKPSTASTFIFAGVPKIALQHHTPDQLPPGGSFFKEVKGRIVEIKTPAGSTRTS